MAPKLENDNENKLQKIPFNISIPQNLKTTPKTKFFIYIPNYKNIQLSQGKNFENGFWSITKNDLKNILFILPTTLQFFQCLLIYKNNSEEEIVSNIYYKNKQFTTGPFITAEFTLINSKKINLRIKSIFPSKNIHFEIEGIPNNAILSKGEKIDNNLWEIECEESKNLIITLPEDLIDEKIYLTITGIPYKLPYFNTTFNLIINLSETKIPHKKNYKELKIPSLKILKDSKIKFDKYILTVKNLPETCCINNAIKLENKWIIKNKTNDEFIIQNFSPLLEEFEITLEYIILNKEFLTTDNNYIKKIKCNFKDKEIQNKNYTKCITCNNYSKCNLFKNFMNYIGDTTILKHIISK